MNRLIIDNDILFGNVIELLREGHDVTIPVKGTSMLPFIRGERDTVTLEGVESGASKVPGSAAKRPIEAGDIVLFRYMGKYILHRVLWVKDGQAHIQGDGVVGKCEHCPLSDIYGRATAILRNNRSSIDPYSPRSMRRLGLWYKLNPVRRWLLAVYRRLPWNKPVK